MPANPARGEAEVTVDGETYVLLGSFTNLARLQSALNVVGLGPMLTMLVAMDARALYEGVRCLATSGAIEKLADANFARSAMDVQKALILAVNGPEPEVKNGDGAAEQTPK